MAREVTRFEASDGSYHTTLEEAVAAEVARILGKTGNGDSSLSLGIARTIVERREEMTQCLAQLPLSPEKPCVEAAPASVAT